MEEIVAEDNYKEQHDARQQLPAGEEGFVSGLCALFTPNYGTDLPPEGFLSSLRTDHRLRERVVCVHGQRVD